MYSKYYSYLQTNLLLSTGLFLGLTSLISVAEARIASNGTFPNGLVLNSTFPNGTFPNGLVLNGGELKLGSTPSQLQLEGSQLVLHLDR